MLALRIIATVFMGLSCITTFFKSAKIAVDTSKTSKDEISTFTVLTLYGWLWRAFVIVAIWHIH